MKETDELTLLSEKIADLLNKQKKQNSKRLQSSAQQSQWFPSR